MQRYRAASRAEREPEPGEEQQDDENEDYSEAQAGLEWLEIETSGTGGPNDLTEEEIKRSVSKGNLGNILGEGVKPQKNISIVIQSPGGKNTQNVNFVCLVWGLLRYLMNTNVHVQISLLIDKSNMAVK